MSLTPQLLHFLRMAAGEPIGIVIETNKVASVKAQLYAARGAANDPDLDVLTIRHDPSAPQSRLMILKQPRA